MSLEWCLGMPTIIALKLLFDYLFFILFLIVTNPILTNGCIFDMLRSSSVLNFEFGLILSWFAIVLDIFLVYCRYKTAIPQSFVAISVVKFAWYNIALIQFRSVSKLLYTAPLCCGVSGAFISKFIPFSSQYFFNGPCSLVLSHLM